MISGDLLKVGTHFKLSHRLHETKEGRLLATSIGSGQSIDELDASAQGAVEALLLAQ